MTDFVLRSAVPWLLLLLTCCAPEQGASGQGGLPAAQVQRAYGEPQGGFPSWYERMIHVLVNRARADPAAALAPCAGCGAGGCCADAVCFSSPKTPLWWREDLAHAARFHAQNLTATGCGMSHTSPCTLVSNIGALYPGSCDGQAACACSGAVTCGSGDNFQTRLSKFGVGGYVAENIAWLGDPFSVFEAWLLETDSDPSCAWRMSNGHRWNILGDYSHLGVGGHGGFTVQDFHNAGAGAHPIPAGAHYPEAGDAATQFRASWYASSAPKAARVNLDGACHGMLLERGSPSNGTYLFTGPAQGGCLRYYFLFTDVSDQSVTFPDTGSFGIGCGDDWSAERPAAGSGCDCVPACAGKECGDDGCGGSCGTCTGQLVCAGGQCQADCAPPLTACGPDCVDILSNPAHCGGCFDPCDPGLGCQNGACVAVRLDGGVSWDSGPSEDSGPGSDGGEGDDTASGGCGCHAPASPGSWPWALALLFFILGWGRRGPGRGRPG
ncbi:MAG: hypothetical protein RBU30_22500 [Polyangia bacterium]|jgi:hypothetical protein|nr:hypothetical protein [Polyangia bacterium]